MDQPTREAIGQQIFDRIQADAEAFHVQLEKSCSDFIAMQTEQFNRQLANNQLAFRLLFPQAPSDVLSALSSTPKPTITPSS